jgi:hypothetical protein
LIEKQRLFFKSHCGGEQYLVSAYEASVQNLVQKGVHSIERSMFSPFDSYMDLAGKDIYIWTANSNNQKHFIRNTVHQKHFESFRTAHFASETVMTVDKLKRWDRWAALCILTVFHKCPKML